MTQFVFERVDRHGDHPAFIDGPSGRVLTHRQVWEGVGRFAGGLRSRGFRAGEVLAIMAPNLPEYAVAFHGVLTAGGTVTTIDPGFTSGEVRRQLADSGARRVLAAPGVLDTVRAAVEGTSVDEIYAIGGGEGAVAFESLLEAEPREQAALDPAGAVAVLPYSCGLGGLPKGVMLTHGCLTSNLAQAESLFSIEPHEATVAVLPFFHTYGLGVLLNGVLRTGRTAVTMPRFRFESFLRFIERYRATRVYVVPPIVLGFAAHPAVDHVDLSSLRQVMCGGAPLDAEVAARAAERLGCEVTQGYGLTEASPITHTTPLGQDRPGASGMAVPNTEVRIVDPDEGTDLGRGRVGEIWVRGPQVMKGYLHDPAATREALDACGWLRTGDLGCVDSDDYLFVVGRRKRVVKCNGLQVSPVELESLLLAHPAVAEAKVTGSPDPMSGEVPVAAVVAAAGVTVDPKSIMAFVAERVARYKRIRRIDLVDELPSA
jgi:4-coumarate--CoA ligase